MRVEVDGQRFDHFLGGFVEVAIDQLARRFEFTAATRGVGDIPFRPGQAAAIWIGEERVLSGWIERIEVGIDERGEEIVYTISGRDKMADVVDSNVDGLGEFHSTIARAADAVLRFLGIDASVIDLSASASRPFSGTAELAKPDPSETAADFLWGVASRRQILLTSDGDGNLVLMNGDPEPIDARLTNRVDGAGNNLTGFRLESDHSKRFATYRVVAQPNVAASAFDGIDLDGDGVTAIIAEHRDPAIRSSRRKTIAGESTYAAADARSRARWEANLARADGFVYTATIPSWYDSSGALWRLNTAPTVEDEFAGIASRLMISHLRFALTSEGETTTLVLRRLDAYAAQAALTEIDRKAQAAADAAEGSTAFILEGLDLE